MLLAADTKSQHRTKLTGFQVVPKDHNWNAPILCLLLPSQICTAAGIGSYLIMHSWRTGSMSWWVGVGLDQFLSRPWETMDWGKIGWVLCVSLNLGFLDSYSLTHKCTHTHRHTHKHRHLHTFAHTQQRAHTDDVHSNPRDACGGRLHSDKWLYAATGVTYTLSMWSSDNMFGQWSTICTWNRREVCNSNAHDHSYTSSNRQSCQKISFFGSMGIEAGCRHVLVNLNINTLQPTFTLTSSCHNHLELATTTDRSWGMLPHERTGIIHSI